MTVVSSSPSSSSKLFSFTLLFLQLLRRNRLVTRANAKSSLFVFLLLFVVFLFASSTFAVVGEAGAGAGAEASVRLQFRCFRPCFRFCDLILCVATTNKSETTEEQSFFAESAKKQEREMAQKRKSV